MAEIFCECVSLNPGARPLMISLKIMTVNFGDIRQLKCLVLMTVGHLQGFKICCPFMLLMCIKMLHTASVVKTTVMKCRSQCTVHSLRFRLKQKPVCHD